MGDDAPAAVVGRFRACPSAGKLPMPNPNATSLEQMPVEKRTVPKTIERQMEGTVLLKINLHFQYFREIIFSAKLAAF